MHATSDRSRLHNGSGHEPADGVRHLRQKLPRTLAPRPAAHRVRAIPRARGQRSTRDPLTTSARSSTGCAKSATHSPTVSAGSSRKPRPLTGTATPPGHWRRRSPDRPTSSVCWAFLDSRSYGFVIASGRLLLSSIDSPDDLHNRGPPAAGDELERDLAHVSGPFASAARKINT